MFQKMRSGVVFFLNGKRVEVTAEDAGQTLSDFLRYGQGLTGTKVVCAEGDCGACTVLRFFPLEEEAGFLPINSCIATVAQMDGSSLITVEGLAGSELTPVQRAMMTCHGGQCGFCTPGFVMALTGLVEKKIQEDEAAISEREAKNALTGNLCRCTGYLPILEAACSIRTDQCTPLRSRFLTQAQRRTLQEVTRQGLFLRTQGSEFFAPLTYGDAATYLKKNPKARVLGGATDLGVLHNKRKAFIEYSVSLHLIKDAYRITPLGKHRIRVGARVTLSELRRYLKERSPEFARFLNLFASPQIKNVATLVGNLANASPIGDTLPPLLVNAAKVEILGSRGKRKLEIDRFFLGYRKTALKRGEILIAIELDLEKPGEMVRFLKVSQRKDLDISAVNAALRVEWVDSKRSRIKRARLAVGGMAATPLRLKRTEKFIENLRAKEDWASDDGGFASIFRSMRAEVHPLSDLRGTAAFRQVTLENWLKSVLKAGEPSA